MKLERITSVPGVCGGEPTIRGLRFTVAFLLKLLASGYSAEDVLREYPELEPDDVRQALVFAAQAVSGRDHLVELASP